MRGWIILAALVTGSCMAEVEDSSTARAQAYTVCAACHLPNGQGIPGAFPPIRNRARDIAALDGGREYLIGSVAFGLMGQISAGGQSYFGVMAGQRGAMDSQAMASALNHVVLDLVDDAEATPVELFTGAEVDAVAEKWGSAGPSKAGTLRGQLVEAHGDDWPK